MTSEQIRLMRNFATGSNDLLQDACGWLKEIAYQLAVMNERTSIAVVDEVIRKSDWPPLREKP